MEKIDTDYKQKIDKLAKLFKLNEFNCDIAPLINKRWRVFGVEVLQNAH